MNFLKLLLVTFITSLSVSICVGQYYEAKFEGKVDGVVKFIFLHDKVKIVAKIRHGLEPGSVYPYHVHEFNVKQPGNCSSTGGHLDPTNASKVPQGEIYKCDPDNPEKCEVGDLSGKYDGLKPDDDGHVYKVDYDHYLEPNDGPYGVGGRSVVIHLPDVNKTRLDCADILPVKKYKRRPIVIV